MKPEYRDLSVQVLQMMSGRRADRWHDPDDPWTPLEWAGAMSGEAGEAANVAKKLRRLEGKIKNLDKRVLETEHLAVESQAMVYRRELAKEVADTILYGMCLFNVIGIDGVQVIREVFNKKSEEYGFPERI